MAIEWIAISAAVIPYLEKYAADRAERLADSVFAKAYRRVVPDQKLIRANQTFVVRFGKELDSSIDLATLTTKAYQEALQFFLQSPSVQDLLQAPLDGYSDLAWELLRAIWAELHLIPLPSDFEWVRVSRTYRQSLHNQMMVDAELRPVVQALAALRAAEAAERTASTLGRIAGPVPAFDLPRYARALKTAYAHLRLGSLDSDWPQYERRFRLEAVYIPQSAKQALPPRDVTRDYLRSLNARQSLREFEADGDQLQIRREEYARLGARPILDVVEDPASQRLVILGDPGLGKSTLLKLLALRWADDPSRALALFIELRRASRESVDATFLSYLEKGTGEICCLPELELDAHLREYESLVLLDGLDEVPQSSRDNTVSKIIRFADDYPRARIIVTTRIHGYYPGSSHPDRFRDAGFQQFTLQDFEDSEIDRFVRLWHREAFLDPAECDRYESRLRRAIADSPAIHELASNPLLLTMMAVLSRTQDLPRDRSRLYERCAELLLKNWDLEKFPELKERRGARDIKDKLGPDQKMRILERVAVAMQEEREGLAGNLIAEDKLKTIVQEELAQLEVPQSWSVADDLIWMLRERNYMLAYLGDRQYGFIHRTFLEYFCARDVKYRLEKTSGFNVSDLVGLFHGHWRDDAWKEVLRLLCGLVGIEYAQVCILALVADEKASDGHEAALLAAQCLQEIRETGQIRTVRNQVRQILLHLTRFDVPYFYDQWGGPEVGYVSKVRGQAIHELAHGWRDDPEMWLWLKTLLPEPRHRPRPWIDWGSTDYDEGLREAAVRELARNLKGDSATLPLLKEVGADDEAPEVRAAAIEEVARGWAHNIETLSWLKEEVLNNAYYRGRETAVREVARGWASSPDTVIWLRSCADGEDAVVRRAALVELVYGWRNVPDTLKLLKRHVVCDGVGFVRAAALSELVRGWKADAENLPRLKDRALHDAEEGVRSVALQALARGWKDEPGTLCFLKECTLKDVAGVVRAAAVREIARGWKGESETLSWVKERASQDAGEEVRIAGIEEVARGWRDEPETLCWIKGRACEDGLREVRVAAVVELVRSWKDEADTLFWLKQRATQDDASEVRVAAVQEIANGWTSDPATLTCLKDYASNHTCGAVRAAAVHELAGSWKEDSETLPLLSIYAGDGDGRVRVAALRELGRARCGDTAVDDLLKDRVTRDCDSTVREAALNELLRREDPNSDVLAILKDRIDRDESGTVRELALMALLKRTEDEADDRAFLIGLVRNDDHPRIRQIAIGALATEWFDPDVLSVLKQRVLQEGDPDVRRDAIMYLSAACEEDLEVLSLLKQRALHDESADVRQTALSGLKTRKPDPDVFGLLKDRVLMDESEEVREEALGALTTDWKDHPETLSLLQNRATGDKSSKVRQAAVWELARLWSGVPEVEYFLDELLQPQPR